MRILSDKDDDIISYVMFVLFALAVQKFIAQLSILIELLFSSSKAASASLTDNYLKDVEEKHGIKLPLQGMDVKDLSSNWRKLQQTLKSKPSGPSTSTPSKPTPKKREASGAARRDGVKRSRLPPSSAPSSASNKRTRVENRERSFKKRKMSKSDDASEVVEEVQNKLSISENGNEKAKLTSVTSTKIQTARELINQGLSPTVEAGKYIAIDCEMVGVGPNPDNDSALARVSIVNFNGDQIYDSYVRPKEMVTDWRTHVSGIAAKHMVEARSLEEVQRDVAKLLDDRVLVGHAIRNDLDALLLSHPKRDIRDTSRHPPYRKFAGGGSPRLKVLASEILGLEIQGAAHSSVEDARATMLLFRKDKEAFEREHAKKWPARVIADGEKGGSGGQKKKKKKSKKKGK